MTSGAIGTGSGHTGHCPADGPTRGRDAGSSPVVETGPELHDPPGQVKTGSAARRRWLLILLFLLAFVVRLVWVSYVQKPGDALYSDMGGYIQRAQTLLAGTQERHYSVAMLPYGTHYLYALEMLLLGPKSYARLAVVQALLGSICVVAVTVLAAHSFRSSWIAPVIGGLACFWYPSLSYCGFFTSEVPYSFFLLLSLVLTWRYTRTGRGALWAGALHGIAFTVRPQMLLTILLFLGWALVRGKSLGAFTIRSLIVFTVPIVLVLVFSAYRYHYFTGELGLISGNGPATRLFGATHYSTCVAFERDASGDIIFQYGFSTPSGPELGLFRKFSFEGRLCDAAVIQREIASYQARLSLRDKLLLKVRNVSLLAYRNAMWPEQMYAGRVLWRQLLFETWPDFVSFCWFPLAVLGLLVVPFRRDPCLDLIGLHVLTMFYAAYAYIGEIRYRVPYDLLLTLLAVLGASVLWNVVRPALVGRGGSHGAGGGEPGGAE